MYGIKTCWKLKQILLKYVLFSNKMSCKICTRIFNCTTCPMEKQFYGIGIWIITLLHQEVQLKKPLQNSPSCYQTIPERSPSHPYMGQWLSPTETTGTVRLSCAEGALSCHGVSALPSLCRFVGPERGVSSERSPSFCSKKLYMSHQSALYNRDLKFS